MSSKIPLTNGRALHHGPKGPCFSALQDKKVDPIVLKIFSYLSHAEWGICASLSIAWKARLVSEKYHPLRIAVRTNQVKDVEELLKKGASAKLCTHSYPTTIVNCPLYIFAKESKRHEIAELLKIYEGDFSENYINNKLVTL